jgi:hypothetical protein
VRAVVVIETYRVEHDVTDRRTPLGPEPADHYSWRDWRRTTEVILDAIDLLTPSPRPVNVARPRIQAPSLEIGF